MLITVELLRIIFTDHHIFHVGVTSTLDHFVDLNIEVLWISPFFKSPLKCMGYDVSNYTAIDPTFGTFDDFRELINEMEKRGLVKLCLKNNYCMYQFVYHASHSVVELNIFRTWLET